MNYFKEASRTLKAIIRAIHGDGNKSAWRDRQRGYPRKYHRQAIFNCKWFLSTRLKIRPCNKLIKPVATT